MNIHKMPQNYIQLTYPYPYKNLSGTASTTLSNTYGGIGAIPAADGNGVLYPVNTVAPAYNSALTFSNTNVAPVFTPILAGGSNIVTAPSLGSVGYVLSVAAGNTTAWVTVSSLPAGNASALESATWESPGTIGSIAPNTGAFTTLTASTSINGPIGSSPNTGSFTTLISSSSTSSSTLPGSYIVNTNNSPQCSFAVVAPNMPNAGNIYIGLGKALSNNNAASITYNQQASVGNNSLQLGFYGGIGASFTMYNSIIASTLNTPLTCTGTVTGTQLISNIAIGTAPLVVTSTTLVPNLYAARSALADTATTNATLTGDVTSSGNATTYNNALPISKGGTGGTGGFASPTGINICFAIR